MARIPLEDNFTDVIGKAQRGLKVADADLAARAGVSVEDLTALKSGKPLIAVLRRVARHLRLNPDALERLATNAWYPLQPDFPRGFAAFNTRYEDMTVNSYLIWDSRSRQAAVFDTGADAQAMLDTIAAERLSVRYLFLTHTHEDHVADLARLREATRADVWVHEDEPAVPGADVQRFREAAHFHLGPLAVKTLLTPGHSPGLTTFYVTGLSWPVAVTGDAIFAASIGGSVEHFDQQFRATRDQILTLPRDTVVAPGHGPLTTVGQEKLHNPFFAR